MITGTRFIATVLLVAAAPLVMADDTSAGVTPGAFVSVPRDSVPMAQTSVLIKGRHVTLSFTPARSERGKVQLLLQGERFGWLGDAEPYPDRHFPELVIAANKVALPVVESFVAQVGKTDVSALLRAAGINPWTIADTPPFVTLDGVKPDALAKLQAAGAVRADGANYLAQWQAARALTFAADQPFSIDYDLRPGYAMANREALANAGLQKRYCFSSAQLARILPAGAGAVQYTLKQIQVPVSVDKRLPRMLRLTLEPEAGVLFVATCARHGSAVAGAQGLQQIPVMADQHGDIALLTIQASQP